MWHLMLHGKCKTFRHSIAHAMSFVLLHGVLCLIAYCNNNYLVGKLLRTPSFRSLRDPTIVGNTFLLFRKLFMKEVLVLDRIPQVTQTDFNFVRLYIYIQSLDFSYSICYGKHY